MYSARLLDGAAGDLERIDTSFASRIVERITWLAEHLDVIKPDALTGDLAGLYKLRVGDYRVIYEIVHKEKAIIIHQIGHRSDIYRRRS